jgi:glycosyltransferase involved in cell wall biosynthesis
MRVVHYLRQIRLEQGGVVRAVLDICAVLAKAGHDVTLLCCDDTDVPAPWRAGQTGFPRVQLIDPPARPMAAFSARQLNAIFERLRGADVVHLHAIWHASNLQIARRCRRAGIPFVLSIHGMLDDWSMSQRKAKKRLFMALGARDMLNRAAFVHSTAQAELDQSRKWYPAGRGVVIPLVFDLTPFRAMPGPDTARAAFPSLRTDRPNILFISRLHYKKGVEHLIRAARILADRATPISLQIAGSGDDAYEQRLRALTADLKLQDSTTFLGMVTGQAKISLYQAADAVVLPTSQENFGFVVFEAMAAGAPLITTAGVDTWPEIKSSGGGLIVEQEAAAIADAVASLLADPARRQAMGRAGREWVLRELDPDRVVERFVDMYRHATGH